MPNVYETARLKFGQGRANTIHPVPDPHASVIIPQVQIPILSDRRLCGQNTGLKPRTGRFGWVLDLMGRGGRIRDRSSSVGHPIDWRLSCTISPVFEIHWLGATVPGRSGLQLQ